MAEIAPFRGLRYNPEKVRDFSEVIIPPYDVISPREQEAFHRASPYNMIRLELGKAEAGDGDENNPHIRAARTMGGWRKEKILVRDERPAIYYYELDYSLPSGERQTRYGFICALRLEEFSSGCVRPHEKTFHKVKEERLGLMLACHANLSSVFALYADPDQLVDRTLRQAREATPAMAFVDRQGMAHRIWRVENLEILKQVRSLMRDKAIFIADGHHRYETALNYRNLQRERFKNAGPRASFEYIMMYLSNLNQSGLTILPTHRLLRHLESGWDPKPFFSRADAFFDISRYDAGNGGRATWQAELEGGKNRKEIVIGIHAHGAESFYLLKAKPEAVSDFLADRGVPVPLRDLDVEVLDRVVLREILELSESFLANENNIHFKHDFVEALEEVQSGHYEVGCFINSTRIEQVQEVATAGLIMPHKSTYFYPKVGSGMVVHLLGPDEEVLW